MTQILQRLAGTFKATRFVKIDSQEVRHTRHTHDTHTRQTLD